MNGSSTAECGQLGLVVAPHATVERMRPACMEEERGRREHTWLVPYCIAAGLHSAVFATRRRTEIQGSS
jgi:hypothetical protein